MTVRTWYEEAPVIATVFDRTGAVIGSASGRRAWNGTLPYGGDYYLTVATPYEIGTTFTLQIEITWPEPAPVPGPEPERIRFAPGATSATVTGYLPSSATQQYGLRALRGQLMSIQSWGTGGPYRLTVQGGDGSPLGSISGGDTWAGTLPATQDYVITLQSPAGASPASYGLLITITYTAPAPAPRPGQVEEIRFAPGATSGAVSGHLDAGWLKQYMLRAGRNQVMTVQLQTEYSRPARLTVTTATGSVLGRADQGQSWSGVLPSSDVYYLTVEAPADLGGVNYLVWVSIR
jgi:hypothetical protein